MALKRTNVDSFTGQKMIPLRPEDLTSGEPAILLWRLKEAIEGFNYDMAILKSRFGDALVNGEQMLIEVEYLRNKWFGGVLK